MRIKVENFSQGPATHSVIFVRHSYVTYNNYCALAANHVAPRPIPSLCRWAGGAGRGGLEERNIWTTCTVLCFYPNEGYYYNIHKSRGYENEITTQWNMAFAFHPPPKHIHNFRLHIFFLLANRPLVVASCTITIRFLSVCRGISTRRQIKESCTGAHLVGRELSFRYFGQSCARRSSLRGDDFEREGREEERIECRTTVCWGYKGLRYKIIITLLTCDEEGGSWG